MFAANSPDSPLNYQPMQTIFITMMLAGRHHGGPSRLLPLSCAIVNYYKVTPLFFTLPADQKDQEDQDDYEKEKEEEENDDVLLLMPLLLIPQPDTVGLSPAPASSVGAPRESRVATRRRRIPRRECIPPRRWCAPILVEYR